MVPKLRFREFKEHWESTYLGDIASKIGSGSTPRGGSEVYKSTGIPFIRSQNVYDEQLNLKDLVFISSDIDEKMKGSRVKPGDILLNITGASIGRSCVVPEYFKQGNVNQHVCIIRLPSNSPKFFQAFISSEKGQKLIDNSQSGSGREGLNFENIRNFRIYSPSAIEQTKIACFLSSVDEKITLLNKQHQLLCQYNKGMMQKIFSQQLRLGGFKERWVSKYLGDVASKIGSGSTPRGGSEVYQSTGVPFIRSQNVHNGQLNLKDLAFISSEVDEKMKGSRVKSGDVLLNITGASIGRSCVVPEYFKHGNVNQHVCIIRLPNDHPKFLQAFISSEQGQKLIDNSQSGSGREGLNFENIRNFKIYFPSIEEQTKIADFLSAIDDKITAKKVQLDKLKTWKQGLLQQMFV
jgi:type I restriction enzyme S subunit